MGLYWDNGKNGKYYLGFTCNPNNFQFYGFCLLIKGYLLLNFRLLEPQVGFILYGCFPEAGVPSWGLAIMRIVVFGGPLQVYVHVRTR